MSDIQTATPPTADPALPTVGTTMGPAPVCSARCVMDTGKVSCCGVGEALHRQCGKLGDAGKLHAWAGGTEVMLQQ